MFDFIKKIISGPQPEILEIPKSKIASTAKKYHDSLVVEIVSYLNEQSSVYKDLVDAAYARIEALKIAKLKNTNIPIRAKQLMEGNRKTYIKRINSFLEHNKFPNVKDESGIIQVRQLKIKFDEELENLTKSTQKSYAVLQEFLANESANLAQSIKRLRELLDNIESELNKRGYLDSLKCVETTSALQEDKVKTSKIKDDQKKLNDDLTYEQKIRDKMKEKLDKIRTGEEYSRYRELVSMKKSAEEDIQKHRHRFNEHFQVLEHALKKYERLSLDKEAIVNYLKNSPQALEDDVGLKILNILEKLKDAIEQNKIDVKDKKREKTLQVINEINRGYMEEHLTVLQNLKNTLQDIDSRLHNNTAQSDIEGAKADLEKQDRVVKALSDELKTLSKTLSSKDSSDSFDRITDLMLKAHNVKLVLK